MTRDQVVDIFMGRQNYLPCGLVALPVEQLEPSAARIRFYREACGPWAAIVMAWVKGFRVEALMVEGMNGLIAYESTHGTMGAILSRNVRNLDCEGGVAYVGYLCQDLTFKSVEGEDFGQHHRCLGGTGPDPEWRHPPGARTHDHRWLGGIPEKGRVRWNPPDTSARAGHKPAWGRTRP